MSDSDNENDENQDFRLGAMIQQSWSKRKHLLEHDYAIIGWVLALLPEIREDVAERLDGNTRIAIERLPQYFIYHQIQTPKHFRVSGNLS